VNLPGACFCNQEIVESPQFVEMHAWTLVGTGVVEPTFRPPDMDDKTINLWRQIEDCRKRGRAQPAERGKPTAVPTRATASS
jgi:hypothetical protein